MGGLGNAGVRIEHNEHWLNWSQVSHPHKQCRQNGILQHYAAIKKLERHMIHFSRITVANDSDIARIYILTILINVHFLAILQAVCL